MRYSVRKATVDDTDRFINIASMFFNESDNAGRVTPRADKFEAFFNAALYEPDDIAILLAFDHEGRIGGYSIPIVQRVFSTEPIGDLYQFYVAPEHRRSNCARALVEATVAQYDAWGCAISYSYAAPGLRGSEKNVALFRNLWQKYGYRQSGIIMTREM